MGGRAAEREVEGQLESLRRQVRARENDLRDLREWYTRVQEEVRFQEIHLRCDTTSVCGLKVSALWRSETAP